MYGYNSLDLFANRWFLPTSVNAEYESSLPFGRMGRVVRMQHCGKVAWCREPVRRKHTFVQSCRCRFPFSVRTIVLSGSLACRHRTESHQPFRRYINVDFSYDTSGRVDLVRLSLCACRPHQRPYIWPVNTSVVCCL